MRSKKQKQRIILGAVVLVVLAAALIFVKQRARLYEESENKNDTLLPLTADQIIAIEYTSPNGTLSYVRDDGQWRDTVDQSGEVDQTKAGELAASMTGVRLYQTMRDVEDLSQYGLEEPRVTIWITDKEGTVTKISIGDDNETTSTVYCCLNDDNRTVYAVSASLTAQLDQAEE